MATIDDGSRLALIQHRDADVREALVACLNESGRTLIAVPRLETLASLLHARVVSRPDVVVLDIQLGRAADLEPIARILTLPALHNVLVLLLTTASRREIAALPSLGPLVRYVALPFDLDDLLPLLQAAPAKQSMRLPPRRSGDVLIAQALPVRMASSPLADSQCLTSPLWNEDRSARRLAHASVWQYADRD